MFREAATSALAGFHAGALSWFNWNLEMLLFYGGRKTGVPGDKPSAKGEKQQQTQPHVEPGRNRNQAKFLGGERSRHCANPAHL